MWHCGYIINSPIQLLPILFVNGAALIIGHNLNSISGLPLQYISPSNDTNATRIIVGPVGQQVIGNTTFFCEFTSTPQINSTIATLTVLG